MQGFINTHFIDEDLFMIDIDYPSIKRHTQGHGLQNAIDNNFSTI